MSRVRAVALAGLLALSLVPAATGPVAGSGTGFVTVDVETSPSQPSPGENVTVSTTVANPVEDSRGYTVSRVSIAHSNNSDNTLEVDRESDTVGSGASVTRNLTIDVDEIGTHEYVLEVRIVSPSGDVVNLERTVTVVVERDDPALSLSADPVGPSGDTAFGLTVSNADATEIRAVTVDVESEDVSFTETRRVIPTLGTGAETTLSFPAEDVETGKKSASATVSYTTSEGAHHTVSESLSTTVERVDHPGNVTLTGVSVDHDDGDLVIQGSANNVGSTNVSAVTLSVADGESVTPSDTNAKAFVGALGASGSSAFDLQATLTGDAERTSIPLRVSYLVDGERVTRTTEVTYTADGTDGNVTLTGVRVNQTGSHLTVRGSASNVGSTNASSVTVAAASGEAVEPAQSESEYFVGSIPTSDFSSFKVNARMAADTNETVSIPLRISYNADGQRVTETTTVEFTPATTSVQVPEQRDSSAPLPLLGGVGAFVLIAGVVFWRRYT